MQCLVQPPRFSRSLVGNSRVIGDPFTSTAAIATVRDSESADVYSTCCVKWTGEATGHRAQAILLRRVVVAPAALSQRGTHTMGCVVAQLLRCARSHIIASYPPSSSLIPTHTHKVSHSLSFSTLPSTLPLPTHAHPNITYPPATA